MFKCSQGLIKLLLFMLDLHTLGLLMLDLTVKLNQEVIKVSHFIEAAIKVVIKDRIMFQAKHIAHIMFSDQEMELVVISKVKVQVLEDIHNKVMAQERETLLIKVKVKVMVQAKDKGKDTIPLSVDKHRELVKITVALDKDMEQANHMEQAPDNHTSKGNPMDRVKVTAQDKGDKGTVISLEMALPILKDWGKTFMEQVKEFILSKT